MNRQQAIELVKNTFTKKFDKNQFIVFIKNLLNHIEDAPFAYKGNLIPDAYSKYLNSLERIGKYNDGEKSVDILIVHLKNETSIERARTMQRNFIAWYLNGSRGGEMKDSALVAFVSANPDDWRFSLIKMDYNFEETKSGKMKIKQEFTPARRWSFLVGVIENSHTAQNRLVPIIENDEHNPTLSELEEAFNIEKVSKEFFEKYRELFIRTKGELDKIVKRDTTIKNDFEDKNINTVDFAKKLLGQILFLYFLQKKGWFGVQRNAEWGSGSKHFLRELFEQKHCKFKNFFNDILEPLFYEGLRLDRSHDDHYYSRFNCKIPFLNGGLFDPMNNYDWVKTDILLSNDLFSNTIKTKEGDEGNGILDVFDRYNFTVREDEPLEKEVAIDPELLGKAYEKFNAIRQDNFNEYLDALKSGKKGEESKFNKQYGVYYTPREIVHYMCQQSLINYLHTELNHRQNACDLIQEDIEKLIHYGENILEHENIAFEKAKRIEEGKQKTTSLKYQMPESIRENAEDIDKLLADIKICDPAIGSGAFPVGVMSEIVKARNALTPYLKNSNRTAYNFKRNCIENSIYGVDIDSGAVEIAKLRLWLSLIVDEGDIKKIKPLPNLDYKIVCGNSLLGVEKDLLNLHLFNELEKLKPSYTNETNPTKKNDDKKRIDELISEITNGNKDFDFEVYFSEIFHQKSGFDLIIANPPWVQSKVLPSKFKKILSNKYKTATGQFDLFNLFIEKSILILKNNGFLVYITPDRFITNIDYKNVRKYILENTFIDEISSLGDDIFENVAMPSAILLTKKTNDKNKNVKCRSYFSSNFESKNQDDFYKNKGYIFKIFGDKNIDNLLENISSKSVTLSEVLLNARGVEIGKNSNAIHINFKKGLKKFLRGEDIEKYRIKSSVYLDISYPNIDYKDASLYQGTKILIRKTGSGINAVIDEDYRYVIQVIYIFKKKEKCNLNERYILSILNSKLIEFWYNYTFGEKNRTTFPHLTQGKILELPIIKIDFLKQKPFIIIVDKILALTQSADYLENQTKQKQVKEYEKQIDQMVYELYGLTEDEIKIVEGEKQ